MIPYDRLAQSGINVDVGLDYCAGDEDFYQEMLRLFSAQGEEKRTEIAALYESANWTDYAIKVHALKSTSLTIGAEALSAQAKELELAGKRGKIISSRQALSMKLKLMKTCKSLVKRVMVYLD